MNGPVVTNNIEQQQQKQQQKPSSTFEACFFGLPLRVFVCLGLDLVEKKFLV